LAERVQNMLDNGFKVVSNANVLGTPENYYINNFWALSDYEAHGCIINAYRIKPLSITDDLMKYYNPDETAVTYCWTGQTSSMVTAYLNVIGYNAVSLAYGTNGMIWSDLEPNHQFVATTVDRPVVAE